MALFGLFKKKESPEEKKPVAPIGEEYRTFAAQFLPEEHHVLVLTGAGSCMAVRADGEKMLTVGTTLTAWMDEDTCEIKQGNFRLVTKADENLAGFLTQRIPRDFILKCTVRLHPEGNLLMLTNLPEPGFDPDLKAMLNAQKQDVTEELAGLTFTRNRSSGAFQTDVELEEQSVLLGYEDAADREVCAATAKTLLADLSGWVERARTMAADTLLERANEISAENEADPLSRDEFFDALEAESIDLAGDTFHLWFNDGGMCFGHAVRVSGTAAGLTEAVMED